VFTAGSASSNVFARLGPRLAEDASCMAALGVDWHHAGFEELIFRRAVSHKTSCVPLHIGVACCLAWFCSASTNSELVARLGKYLKDVLSKTRCEWLIGPAGIGFHADHLLVHRACREAVAARPCDVTLWFYHDFPYWVHCPLRQPRLVALGRSGRHRTVEIHAQGEELALRKEMVVMYESQLDDCFGSREQAEALLDRYPQERFFVPG